LNFEVRRQRSERHTRPILRSAAAGAARSRRLAPGRAAEREALAASAELARLHSQVAQLMARCLGESVSTDETGVSSSTRRTGS
jgi:hypothetical protein